MFSKSKSPDAEKALELAKEKLRGWARERAKQQQTSIGMREHDVPAPIRKPFLSLYVAVNRPELKHVADEVEATERNMKQLLDAAQRKSDEAINELNGIRATYTKLCAKKVNLECEIEHCGRSALANLLDSFSEELTVELRRATKAKGDDLI